MKLEDQVVSYELSIKLKELGIKYDSLYEWDKTREYLYLQRTTPRTGIEGDGVRTRAYLATELLDICPSEVNVDNNYYYLTIEIGNNNFVIKLITKYLKPNFTLYQHDNKNLANALAKLTIYLIENNLWSPNNDTKTTLE